MKQLVLASQSPRRKELLEKAGFRFEVLSIEISEIPNENMSLEDQIKDLAWQKAKALVDSGKLMKSQEKLVLAADTVVVLEQKIMGKPKDLDESRSHICRLSGRTHRVVTAICMWDLGTQKFETAAEWADVTFRNLTEAEIEEYVVSRDGMDKAGAYGIQGPGRALVESLDGNFDNVMGLPINLVERLLKKNGWIVDRR